MRADWLSVVEFRSMQELLLLRSCHCAHAEKDRRLKRGQSAGFTRSAAAAALIFISLPGERTVSCCVLCVCVVAHLEQQTES